MVILGVTGIMLYSPLVTASFFEGWTLNVALWVHRIEACLAMLHVFVIHFAIAHLRRHNFPMDRAMFGGDADMLSVKEERPAWIQRLKNEGKLDSLIVEDIPPAARIGSFLFGLGAVALGIYLVIGALQNVAFINW